MQNGIYSPSTTASDERKTNSSAVTEGVLLHFLNSIWLLFVFLLICFQCYAAESDAGVRDLFTKLKTAVKSGNGNGAADLVSSDTIALCEQARTLALSSAGVDLESSPQTTVFLVFVLRYYAPSQELRTMHGKEVIAWAVSKGLVPKDAVNSLSIDRVHTQGIGAFASMLVNGQPAPEAFLHFSKETNQWRVDAAAMSPALEVFSLQQQWTLGKTKIDVAADLMNMVYGVTVPRSIIKGPLK